MYMLDYTPRPDEKQDRFPYTGASQLCYTASNDPLYCPSSCDARPVAPAALRYPGRNRDRLRYPGDMPVELKGLNRSKIVLNALPILPRLAVVRL